ncbi:unnamed protein product [Closterium sp. NIES-65]|nr:unnamed protein product [Closterium sp. NIES-65]
MERRRWGEGGVGEKWEGGEGLGGERKGGSESGKEGVSGGVGDGRQEGGIGGRDEGEVDEGEVGRGVRDGKGRLLKEGAGEGRWHGGWRGRRLKGGEEEGMGEGEGGLNGEVKKAEGGKGEGEDEGKAEGMDQGKGEGNDEGNGEEKNEEKDEDERKDEGKDEEKDEGKDEGKDVGKDVGKEEGERRGGEAMPEAWRRFYSGLPKVVDAEGHENMWKFPIWVALAVNMCVRAAVGIHGATTSVHAAWDRHVCTGCLAGVADQVPFLQSQLACCCEWAFFLDSDAYMRMDHHRLSIPTWIQSIKQPHQCNCWQPHRILAGPLEGQLWVNYFDWLLRDNLTDSLEGQVWLPQDPALLLQPATALQPEGAVALIPRNGDSKEGFFGEAEALFRKDTDYVNAGVMLWRRSPATFKVGTGGERVPCGRKSSLAVGEANGCGGSQWLWGKPMAVGEANGCGGSQWLWGKPMAVGEANGCGGSQWLWGKPMAVGEANGCGGSQWLWGKPMAVGKANGCGESQWLWGKPMAVGEANGPDKWKGGEGMIGRRIFKLASDSFKLASDSFKLASDSSKLASDSFKLASDSFKLASDSFKLASDSFKLASDSSKLASDSFKLASDSFKLASDSFKLASDNFKLASVAGHCFPVRCRISGMASRVATTTCTATCGSRGSPIRSRWHINPTMMIILLLFSLSPSLLLQFLQQWYGEYSGDYHLYGHVWEQDRLNKVVRWPQWRGRVIVVPHQELTGPQGAMVRHMWGGIASEERDRVVYAALEEALGSLQQGQ